MSRASSQEVFRAELVKRLAADAMAGSDRAMKSTPGMQAFVRPEIDETSEPPTVRVVVRTAMQDRWVELDFAIGTPAEAIRDAVDRAYRQGVRFFG